MSFYSLKIPKCQETILPVSSLPKSAFFDQSFLSSILCFSHCRTQEPFECGLNQKPGTELLDMDSWHPPLCLWKHKVCSGLQIPPVGACYELEVFSVVAKPLLLFYVLTMKCKVEASTYIKCVYSGQSKFRLGSTCYVVEEPLTISWWFWNQTQPQILLV